MCQLLNTFKEKKILLNMKHKKKKTFKHETQK